MTSERDPRTDWRVGDVFDWGEGPQEIRHIEPDGSVWIVDLDVESVGLHDAEFIRKWASNAQVVRKGEE